MIKLEGVWPQGETIQGVGVDDFIWIITGIEKETSDLYNELLLIESSLNMNASWNILKRLIKRMVLKVNANK